MLDLLLQTAFTPFTLSLALLFGLFALELALLLIGASLLTSDSADADVPTVEMGDMDGIDLDTLDVGNLDIGELDLADYDLPSADVTMDIDGVDAAGNATAAPDNLGLLAWLGFGKTPAAIWLATFLAAYGVSGIALQLLMLRGIGSALPALAAGLIALPAGLLFARSFAKVFARLLPKSESSALSERSLGRRRGVVSQGTARRGAPAQVRVLDGFGNFHYLQAEPLEKTAEIGQGTEVLVLRNLREGGYRILPLS